MIQQRREHGLLEQITQTEIGSVIDGASAYQDISAQATPPGGGGGGELSFSTRGGLVPLQTATDLPDVRAGAVDAHHVAPMLAPDGG